LDLAIMKDNKIITQDLNVDITGVEITTQEVLAKGDRGMAMLERRSWILRKL